MRMRDLGLVNGSRTERYSLCTIAQKKATEPTPPACSMKDRNPSLHTQPGYSLGWRGCPPGYVAFQSHRQSGLEDISQG